MASPAEITALINSLSANDASPKVVEVLHKLNALIAYIGGRGGKSENNVLDNPDVLSTSNVLDQK